MANIQTQSARPEATGGNGAHGERLRVNILSQFAGNLQKNFALVSSSHLVDALP